MGLSRQKLGNLPNWLKAGRRLIGETKDSYVTLKDLK